MIPIVLVTGFLGAGKTTFINWLLKSHPDLKISVILNEFGDIPLETEFVKQKTEGVIELANGCMCCVAKSDIPRVVSYILEHSPQTEYIVIEASGLSDPDPVREALTSAPVNQDTFLESTVCVVDAVNFNTTRSSHPLVTSQIADSDLVVISKAAQVEPDTLATLKQQLRRLTPEVRVLVLDEHLEPSIFLTGIQPATAQSNTNPNHHHHAHEDFETLTYQTSQTLDIQRLETAIRELPPEILRVKGVVHTVVNQQPQAVTIQKVGAHVALELTETSLPETTILVIGTKLDRNQISQAFDSCKL